MNSKYINKRTLYIIDFIILICCIIMDRLTKYFAIKKLKDHPSISVFSGILEFRYLENSGAAFGLLKNQKNFFFLLGFFVVFASIYVLIKTPARKKYICAHIFLTCIMAGAIGNIIDRLLYGFVVDFIYFYIINFPIFNIADIFITIGTAILTILLLFYYREDDLNFLRFMEKKIRDI